MHRVVDPRHRIRAPAQQLAESRGEGHVRERDTRAGKHAVHRAQRDIRHPTVDHPGHQILNARLEPLLRENIRRPLTRGTRSVHAISGQRDAAHPPPWPVGHHRHRGESHLRFRHVSEEPPVAIHEHLHHLPGRRNDRSGTRRIVRARHPGQHVIRQRLEPQRATLNAQRWQAAGGRIHRLSALPFDFPGHVFRQWLALERAESAHFHL